MLDWLGSADFGPVLARFRRRLDERPAKSFAELTLPGKIGRLALIAAALLVVSAPLLWLLIQSHG
jgi:hypothetical protein